MKIVVQVLVLLEVFPTGTSVLSYGVHDYQSRPAHFGMQWEPPEQSYQAQLHFLSENPKLCEKIAQPSDVVDGGGDGPVALLAERGDCSFESKANIAMKAYPNVSFLVVYDDVPRPTLVAMRETYSTHSIGLGMLFISHHSGLELLRYIEEANENATKRYYEEARENATNNYESNVGISVTMDGIDPLLEDPSLAKLQRWLVMVMGGLFSFLSILGCFLILIQVGIIPPGTGMFLLNNNHIRRARRLLTDDEIIRLRNKFGGHIVRDGGDENACCVCLEAIDTNAQVLVLPCSHAFHMDCINPWLTERQATCPLCKFDVLEHIIQMDSAAAASSSSSGITSPSSSESQNFYSWISYATRILRGWSLVAAGDDDDSEQPSGEMDDSASHDSSSVNDGSQIDIPPQQQ